VPCEVAQGGATSFGGRTHNAWASASERGDPSGALITPERRRLAIEELDPPPAALARRDDAAPIALARADADAGPRSPAGKSNHRRASTPVLVSNFAAAGVNQPLGVRKESWPVKVGVNGFPGVASSGKSGASGSCYLRRRDARSTN